MKADTSIFDGEVAVTRVFLVSEGSRHISIPVTDIIYFSANSPYINIHVPGKKFLFSDSLKSIHDKLDSREFLRVHKSTIINVKKVQSFKSRQNGDYDLTMSDGTIVRLSRNYVRDFKTLYGH